jgi:hypothetical protein
VAAATYRGSRCERPTRREPPRSPGSWTNEPADARAGKGELDRAKRMMEILPRSILGLSLRLSAFLTSNLRMDLSSMGMPREAFGSAMVSNIGVFGVGEGWAPLSPIYRFP